MAEVILMPRLSDTMTEGVIAEWHKKVGDTVKKGDLLAEVETDKATMDLESYKDGTLLHIGADKGSKLQVNDLLAIIGKPGEDISGLLKGNGADKAKDEKAQGTSDKVQGTSDKAQGSSDKAQGSSDKAQVTSIKAQEDKTQTNNQPTTSNKQPTTSNKQQATSNQQQTSSTDDGRVKASPLAKKLATEKGIDLNKIQGTGDGGRITRQDIDSYKQTTDDRPQTIHHSPFTIHD